MAEKWLLDRLRKRGLWLVLRELEGPPRRSRHVRRGALRPASGQSAAPDARKGLAVRMPGEKWIAGYVREGATDAEIREVLRKRDRELAAEGRIR